MSRLRVYIVVVVLAAFVAGGGYIIYRSSGSGGQSVSFDVKVTSADQMEPSELDARQNDNVTINLRSDTDGEVHLHGYDIAFETKAGQVVSHTFKADKTGTFEIEWESTSTHLGELVVNP